MSANKHILLVKSDRPPVIEFDGASGSAYIRFKKTKVDSTLEQCTSGPIITVDLDRSGDVVGIEAILWDEFEIANVLKIARVRADGIDFSRAKFRQTPKHLHEAEEAFA